MFIKRNASLFSTLASVKRFGRMAAATLSLCMVAAPASAFSPYLVERAVTVRFKVSDLSTPKGVQKAYDILKTKAERYCEADNETRDLLGETVSECTTDLLTQFVKSTGIESLEAHHLAQ